MKTEKDIRARLFNAYNRLAYLDIDPNWTGGSGEWRSRKKEVDVLNWVLDLE